MKWLQMLLQVGSRARNFEWDTFFLKDLETKTAWHCPVN